MYVSSVFSNNGMSWPWNLTDAPAITPDASRGTVQCTCQCVKKWIPKGKNSTTAIEVILKLIYDFIIDYDFISKFFPIFCWISNWHYCNCLLVRFTGLKMTVYTNDGSPWNNPGSSLDEWSFSNRDWSREFLYRTHPHTLL